MEASSALCINSGSFPFDSILSITLGYFKTSNISCLLQSKYRGNSFSKIGAKLSIIFLVVS
ncbi:hypothetical protein A1C_05255 [Rickettsia akari str. Hartford]|uniref:Uncharacterized protein n=1 Tax=Rickettsia akari (strain Hartford) TaxID=293614 RepID=A8GPH8_RICAH|nr:hypothetical protein A1C_05255 [Rickettsia akari str. Hartford]